MSDPTNHPSQSEPNAVAAGLVCQVCGKQIFQDVEEIWRHVVVDYSHSAFPFPADLAKARGVEPSEPGTRSRIRQEDDYRDALARAQYRATQPSEPASEGAEEEMRCVHCGEPESAHKQYCPGYRLSKYEAGMVPVSETRFPPPPQPTPASESEREAEDLPRFDAGILAEFGGGNVSWWHDYIRNLLDGSDIHYQEQHAAALSAQSREVAELREERDYWKSHAAESDSELCALQDALGHPPENGDALEKGIERLRTLIASEGELGDLREQLAAIHDKDHELNAADELIKAEHEIERLNALVAAERAKREGVCVE